MIGSTQVRRRLAPVGCPAGCDGAHAQAGLVPAMRMARRAGAGASVRTSRGKQGSWPAAPAAAVAADDFRRNNPAGGLT
jgi:hypothetical protein